MDDDYCTSCSGTGEGMHDGSRCHRCGGSGITRDLDAEWDAKADDADHYWQEMKDREALPVPRAS